MPTKRLVLGTPLSDGVEDFPYVDVRRWALGEVGDPAALIALLDPTSAAIDENSFFNFQVDITLQLGFYRLVSSRRVFLADSRKTPILRYFTIPKRLKVTGIGGSILLNSFNFWRIIYDTADSDAARYSTESENTFESIILYDDFQLIDFVRRILIQECGPDFTGMTVVEDAE